MKIGDLGSILDKDPLELAKAYEIGESVEVLDVETISKILPNEITALKKALIKRGKDDGYGMAERLVKSDIEKRLKSDFGIDGENLDELFTGLKSKLQTKDPKDDNKLQIEFDRLKDQKSKIESEFETFKKSVETKEKLNTQFGVFDKYFSQKFDVKSERLKRLAFEGFIKDFEIEQGKDSDFAIDKTKNKPVSDNLDDLIFNLYKDDFQTKTEHGKAPRIPDNDPTQIQNIGNTKSELLTQLRSEKDPIRIQQINAKIKELSK